MFEKNVYDAALAAALNCPNKAYMIEYMIWSIESKQGRQYEMGVKDDKQYMWDSQKEWHDRIPWAHIRTIRRYIAELRDIGLVETACLSENPRDRTLFYRVNMDKYNELRANQTSPMRTNCPHASGQKNRIHADKLSSSMRTKEPHVPSTNTHTNTHTNTPHKKCVPFDHDMAKRWLDYNRLKSPNGRFNELKFSEAIMRMRTKFSMAEKDIGDMLTWIQQDDFWGKLSPSPVGLLRKSPSEPDLTKLEQVLKQISGRKKSKSERVMDSILKNESEVDPDYNPLRLT